MSVDIVLATYNGERFIREQLESLLAQSFSNFRVLIGDDGSTDSTLEIISDYLRHYPDRFFLLNSPGCLGACGNFFRLLSASTADYVFFSDQDDVWDPDKVAVSMEAMLPLEKKHGINTPLLVHTDLRVVDTHLGLISSSFFDMQRLNSGKTRFRDLLFQNMVTGCTTVVNRALIRKALPVPQGIIMHDWWLALVASAFGQIHFVNRPTISYRQHSNNEVGAKGWSPHYLMNRLAQLSNRRKAADLGYPILRQAKVFNGQFRHELSPGDLLIVSQIAGFDRCTGISRLIKAARIRARKHGLFRTIALYWLLILADFKQPHERGGLV